MTPSRSEEGLDARMLLSGERTPKCMRVKIELKRIW